ncbi:MAG: hypothetical protein KME28_04370 [Pelatocladus maniniholoensis HA4357-MV3]|jgi:hypothetical protein|uniref:Uncharacterized protein n=1 Tax=Pelatocladus maniniholoensis HA4357-MV3 TaxID=1117104 RepID=A0A9E3H5S5_9NOST|nr:hypothetical protein [Pelatocladus maniniholoensis HA4357-MV3]
MFYVALFSSVLIASNFTDTPLLKNPINKYNYKPYVVSQNENESKNEDVFSAESEGFLFQITKCKRISPEKTECNLLIKNKREDRGITIYGNPGKYSGSRTRIIDSSGNEAFASKVTIGDKSNRAYVSTSILRDIPIKAIITFDGVITNNISAYVIVVNSSDNYQRTEVKFLPESSDAKK